jgi:membrane-bound metal-dependent hydrolase YbcI (DUF457 family)
LPRVDFFSHGTIPFAITLLALRNPRLAAAVLVGAIAPDLDITYGWIARLVPEAYFLGHRAISHTLIGAPLMALGLLAVLTRRPIRQRIPLLREVTLTRATMLAAVIGAESHLILDAITITGIPLLWPITSQRVRLDAYFFIHPAMAVAAIAGAFPIIRGRFTRRQAHTLLIVLGLILATAGLVRAATIPPLEDGMQRTPGPFDWQWQTARDDGDTVTVSTWTLGRIQSTGTYLHENRTHPAVATCQALPVYTAFAWDAWGPPLVIARADGAGGWNVTSEDAVAHHLNVTRVYEYLAWPPDLGQDERGFHCHVDAEGEARLSSPYRRP